MSDASEKNKPALSGVLLVDKPGQMTSHDVVGRVRRIFGQREVSLRALFPRRRLKIGTPLTKG